MILSVRESLGGVNLIHKVRRICCLPTSHWPNHVYETNCVPKKYFPYVHVLAEVGKLQILGTLSHKSAPSGDSLSTIPTCLVRCSRHDMVEPDPAPAAVQHAPHEPRRRLPVRVPRQSRRLCRLSHRSGWLSTRVTALKFTK